MANTVVPQNKINLSMPNTPNNAKVIENMKIPLVNPFTQMKCKDPNKSVGLNLINEIMKNGNQNIGIVPKIETPQKIDPQMNLNGCPPNFAGISILPKVTVKSEEKDLKNTVKNLLE